MNTNPLPLVPGCGTLRFSDCAALIGMSYLDLRLAKQAEILERRGFRGVRDWILPFPSSRSFRVSVHDIGEGYPLIVSIGGVLTVAQVGATVRGQIDATRTQEGWNRYFLESAYTVFHDLHDQIGNTTGRPILWVGHSGGGAVATACHVTHGEVQGFANSTCITFGAPCCVSPRPGEEVREVRNLWRFVNLGDGVPGMPTQSQVTGSRVGGIFTLNPSSAGPFDQFPGGIVLYDNTWYAPMQHSWSSNANREVLAAIWLNSLATSALRSAGLGFVPRPGVQPHDIRVYINRLEDAELTEEGLGAPFVTGGEEEPAAIPLPTFVPSEPRVYSPVSASVSAGARTFSFPARMVPTGVFQMVIIPKEAKAQVVVLGSEVWVAWKGALLFRCPTVGKAKTTARKWNLMLYHVGTRGGQVNLDGMRDAWDAFMNDATVNPSFKPEWIITS